MVLHTNCFGLISDITCQMDLSKEKMFSSPAKSGLQSAPSWIYRRKLIEFIHGVSKILKEYIFFYREIDWKIFFSEGGDLNTQIKWMTEYAEDFGNGKILGIGIFF